MKIKKNIHIAKKQTLRAVKKKIVKYNKKYHTPKYLYFMGKMLEAGWEVKLYTAKVSKYVFIRKGDLLFKLRFSNHKPLTWKEEENDCDFYVGMSNFQSTTTEKILNKLNKL